MKKGRLIAKKPWAKDGQRLRALRKYIQKEEGRRITQTEFGKRFGGFSVRQLTSYESGECKVPLPLLIEIKRHGYSLDELFEDGVVIQEPAAWQKEPRRLRLMSEVRELVADTDVSGEVIEAALRVIRIFKRAKTEKEAL